MHEYDPEASKITVGEYEITIGIGHGGKNPPLDWEMNPCSGGGAVTCFSESNFASIPPEQRVPQLPGHDEVIYSPNNAPGDPAKESQQLRDTNIDTDGNITHPRLHVEVRRTLKSAWVTAQKLCTDCCSQVSVNSRTLLGSSISNDRLPLRGFDYKITCGETKRENFNRAVDEYVDTWKKERDLN